MGESYELGEGFSPHDASTAFHRCAGVRAVGGLQHS